MSGSVQIHRPQSNINTVQTDFYNTSTATSPSGDISAGTFPPHALGGYAQANPGSASTNVVAGVVGMVTHIGADGSGNQHNLGVLGLTNNKGTRGSELISNGAFASDTVWTKGTGFTISGGVCTASAGSGSTLFQAITLTASNLYRVQYTLTRSAGSITPSVGGAPGVTRSASGTYTEWILAGGTTYFDFTKDASFAGTIDNVSVTRACHVQGAYAVEGRTQHDESYTGIASGFIAAAATVTEGASGMILVYADYLSEAMTDHAHMYLKFSFLGNDESKIFRTKGPLDGFKTSIVVETGDFTLSHATHGGRTVICTDATPAITVPNSLPTGFTCTLQTQAAQGTFSGTATIENASSHTKSRTAKSVVGITVRSNSNGSSAIAILAGDTGT